jgi:hypothetical protein
VPANFPILTCTRCGAERLEAEDAHKLDAILFEQYRGELRRRARESIHALRGQVSQRRLELLMGLSQGYLSRLAAQAGNPSPALVLLLSSVARDPQQRLAELEAAWLSPPTP